MIIMNFLHNEKEIMPNPKNVIVAYLIPIIFLLQSGFVGHYFIAVCLFFMTLRFINFDVLRSARRNDNSKFPLSYDDVTEM